VVGLPTCLVCRMLRVVVLKKVDDGFG
jgi:hypothetical protein